MPTLGRRLIRLNLVLGAGFAIMAATGVWGLLSLRSRVLEVVDEYEELRIIEQTITAVTVAGAELDSMVPDRRAARVAVATACDRMSRFSEHQRTVVGGEGAHQDEEAALVAPVIESLNRAESALRSDVPDAEVEIDLAAALAGLRRLESTTEPEASRVLAVRQASVALIVTAGLAAVLSSTAVLAGIRGYHGIMRPVRGLQEGVRRLSAGDFQSRIEPAGDLELAELAREFNRMATELDTLYRVMDDRVKAQSRELVRSERLASVGFLAAGIAHELNNPLGIITGYAELAERWIAAPERDAVTEAETREALGNIREEAYRCKRITEQLLGLARRGGEDRQIVDPATVIRDVVSLARGLPAARDRLMVVDAATGVARVRASEPELKQVLLNLAMNAVDATDAGIGRIAWELRAEDGGWSIVVRDNGCGIDATAIGEVFEPFVTRRRAGADRGVGLGLAISHAIVQAHGGVMRVRSDGAGRGASFSVWLPAAADSSPATIRRERSDGVDG